MVREELEELLQDILDDGGREIVIDCAIKRMTDVRPKVSKELEREMKKVIKIDGFRDFSMVPKEILIKKIKDTKAIHNELEEAMSNAWLDLHAELQLTTEQLVKQYEEALQVLDNEENLDNKKILFTLVNEITSKLLVENDCSNQEAQMMILYVIIQSLDSSHDVKEFEATYEPECETQVIATSDEDEKVDIDHWLLLMEKIPFTSELWLTTVDFARSIIELTERKLQEKKDAQGVIKVLEAFKEKCSKELTYHEMLNANVWSTEKLNLKQLEHVVADILSFEQLLLEHSELISKPMLNKHEERQWRTRLDETDQKIESMFKQLDSQLNPLGNEPSKTLLNEMDTDLTETQTTSVIDDGANSESKKNIKNQQTAKRRSSTKMNQSAKKQVLGQSNLESKQNTLESDTSKVNVSYSSDMAHMGHMEHISLERLDDFISAKTKGLSNLDKLNVSKVPFYLNKFDTSVRKTEDTRPEEPESTTLETTKQLDLEPPQKTGHVITPAEASFDLVSTETEETAKTEETINMQPVSTVQANDNTQLMIHKVNSLQNHLLGEANTSDITPDVTLSQLYGEIHADCIKPSLYPRAWLLIKSYQEYGGNDQELENLPSCSLLELAYMAQRMHHDQALYYTYKTRLEQLNESLNAPSFSKCQAFMYFATALPLSLVYGSEPLRSSFYYADNVPEPFQEMYSNLVAKAKKVTIPIIDLRGTEEKHRFSQQQQRKIAGDLLLVFNRATMKSQNKMDDYFFPRYGNGPLQWVKDVVESEKFNEAFSNKLSTASAEAIFSEFTDPKWVGITPLREKTIEKINNILNLAKAWEATFAETIAPDDYQLAAFRELTCLFEDHYDEWLMKLDKQEDELTVAATWMKIGLEQLFEQIRGVNYAVECAR